ncbi:MAG: hypothetical protein PHW96_01850 [Candidatus Nanoarchaeia archaeon]|nr:hypothetical protein [Candidatus Nanoarchaeia archaeon]
MSELMMDLSYSSLFLNDKNLSKHVKELFEDFVSIETETLKLMFKVKINDAERLALMDFLEYIKDYANAAMNVSRLAGNSLPSIVKEILSETDERVVAVTIPKNSFLENKTIGSVKVMTNTGLKIISVKRGNKWFFNINKSFRFKSNDFIIGAGTLASNELFNKMLKGHLKI